MAKITVLRLDGKLYYIKMLWLIAWVLIAATIEI